MPPTMRSWTGRQSESVLYIVRTLQRQRPTPHPQCDARPYHPSSSLQRSRAAEREAKKLTRERDELRARRTVVKEQQAQWRNRGSSHLFDDDGKRILSQTQLESRWRNRVRTLLHRFEAIIVHQSDDIAPAATYLRKLDPDASKWPVFSQLLQDSIESIPRVQSGGPPGSIRRLGAIIEAARVEEQWVDPLWQQVEFAFTDYVLASQPASSQNTFDLRYPTEWYPLARELQREIHLHVGPTNSGKTYTALKRLEESRNGFYAGPLRLLAHEVYSRFNNRGIACDLITGDDVRLSSEENTAMYASTVEMVSTSRESDVGVIDEIQMLGDEERGWAWTRALLGARAKELHLCGETRVVPLIREIVASMGDTLHVHQYERLNPLKVMSKSLRGDLTKLRKGDCIVAFSIVNIHGLKRQIELDTGRRCAIVYGSLPPETRAQQAALFNDPDNEYDFLVASDAIGMGLNLSIKRVIFETTTKFNGTTRERLSVSQLKQIAGRAGRYRTAQDDKSTSGQSKQDFKTTSHVGLVTCLDEADLPFIQQAMATEAPPLRAAGLLPPGEVYEEFANRLPAEVPFEYIVRNVHEKTSLRTRYSLCDARDLLSIAKLLDAVPGLSIEDRLTICASPASIRGRSGYSQQKLVQEMGTCLVKGDPFTIADIDAIPLEVLDVEISSDRTYLEKLEFLHKSIILFLWLSYRFPRIMLDQDMATLAKELTEEKINIVLTKFSANPRLAARLTQMKKSSAVLREKLAASQLAYPSTPTMNPDASVEEIERRAREEAQRTSAEQPAAPELESDLSSISEPIPNMDHDTNFPEAKHAERA